MNMRQVATKQGVAEPWIYEI